jgi:hypothetical protein
VIIVQATPFNADGSLDLVGLRANTQFLIDRCKGRRFVLVLSDASQRNIV